MTVFAERVILRFHDPRQTAHQHAAFAGQVAEDFLLERGREQVTRADGDADGQAALLGAARVILADCETGIDACAGEEVAAHIQAGAFRRDHDHIDILGRNDARLILVHDGEPVREVDRIAGLQVFLDRRPYGALGGVGHQQLDDGRFLNRRLDVEQGFPGHPAVLDGAVPVALELRCLADDHVEPVVLHVEGLGRPLDAVADHGDHFVLQDLVRFREREFLARNDFLFDAAKINLSHMFSFIV